ncbi:MAG: hypothetical protein JO263_00260 [Candidatus Eremiobacteraeota bacterium]|nr:hypothetical protein [Candidatus Eremiobacteraeota bacterium]
MALGTAESITFSLRAIARDGLVVLQKHPNRHSVRLIRDALRRRLGAGDCDSLQDMLARCDAPPHRDVLVALERAVFTSDADLPRAIDAIGRTLHGYAQSLR